jgi:hypothetical protein
MINVVFFLSVKLFTYLSKFIKQLIKHNYVKFENLSKEKKIYL